MKNIVIIVVGLAAGFVVGGLGPRAEIRSLRAEVDRMTEDGCADPKVGRGMAALFQGRPGDVGRDEARSATRYDESADPASEENAPEPGDEPEPTDEPEVVDEDDGSPWGEDEPDWEDLDAVKEFFDMRSAQSKAALMEEADLDEGAEATFDDAWSQMNSDLKSLAQDMIAAFDEAGGEPSELEMLRFGADAMDIMVRAGETASDLLTDEELARIDERSVSPFSYLDGDLFELLSELDQ